MGWIRGVGERQFLVEDDGTTWDVAKRVQYDPETLEPIEFIGDKNSIKTERRAQLHKLKWGDLRKEHKSVTGRDERKMKKDELIEDILRQEFE